MTVQVTGPGRVTSPGVTARGQHDRARSRWVREGLALTVTGSLSLIASVASLSSWLKPVTSPKSESPGPLRVRTR